MPNIDDLSISVKSNVTSATNSIDKLITKLGALSASLGQVNTSGFSAMASGIRQISSASNSISGNSAKNITELSLAIRKFGGKASTQATANLPQLGNAIMQLSNSMASVGGMTFNTEGITNLASAINKLGGVKSSTAVQNIPQLTVALQGMVGSLNQIGTAGTSISALGQLASSLSKLGGKTVTNALTNIPQLTNALMQMMSTLSKAPQVSYNVIQLVNSMANLASQGSKVGTASNSLYNGFMRFGKGADHARKKSFSLASAIGKLYASYFLLFRLFRGIGKGIDLASSLTEVQNVVDVSFGQYRDKIEQFADTSIQDYGMSELTAKQIASRYQAMGGAIGFAQGEMANMSITLTKLAADMASFYNVEQAAVAEDLEAIFTQQTRPLRQYGIDLTQASLESWLLTKGIETNIAALTQQEKVLLNYNYVLEKTGMAQGDFARTQDTWANQLRILRQQFEALSAIIGQNFIYALKPLVSALNTVMGKLIQFARVVSDSLGTIFGWKYEVSGGGLLNNEIGNVEDFSAGLSGASDKAKKLKQQLQGFDELNVLTTNTPSSGGAGGGGVSDLPEASYGQWVPTDDDEGFFTSNLDTLYKLGEYISTTLTDQLRSIDWQEVYQGAKDFGFDLADFLNGLISPDLFGATGRTIAGALNTAIYASLSFSETFDFDEFGSSIAQGVNEFFDEFDFLALGKSISTWVKGLKESILVAIAEIEWGDVLKGIGDVFKGLGADGIATLFGFYAISRLFKTGLFGALGSALRTTTTLPGALTTGLNGIASKIQIGFIAGLGTAFAGFNLGEWIYEKITGDDTSDINYLDYLFGDNKVTAEELGGYVKEDLSRFPDFIKASAEMSPELWTENYKTLPKNMQKNFRGLYEAINGDGFKKLGSTGVKNLNKFSKVLKTLGVDTSALAKVVQRDFDTISKSGDVIGTMSESLPQYGNIIKNGLTESFNTTKNNVSNAFSYLSDLVFGKNNEIYNNTSTKSKETADVAGRHYGRLKVEANTAWKGLVGTIANSNSQIEKDTQDSSEKTIDGIVKKYGTLQNSLSSLLGNTSSTLSQKFAQITKISKDNTYNAKEEAIKNFRALRDGSNTPFNELKTKVVKHLSDTKDKITNQNSSWLTAGEGLVNNLKSGVTTKWTGKNSLVSKLQELAKALDDNVTDQKSSWTTAGNNLVDGLKSGVTTKWNGTGGLISKVKELAKSLTKNLKDAFDINSPSKEWEDVGVWLPPGLEKGILGGESDLNKSVIAMGHRLTENFNGSLALATPKAMIGGSYDFGVTSTMAHNFTADGSMTGDIAKGVRDGVYAAQSEQNALLREQNELLTQILAKEGISLDEVYNGVVRKNRETFDRTGTNLLFV